MFLDRCKDSFAVSMGSIRYIVLRHCMETHLRTSVTFKQYPGALILQGGGLLVQGRVVTSGLPQAEPTMRWIDVRRFHVWSAEWAHIPVLEWLRQAQGWARNPRR